MLLVFVNTDDLLSEKWVNSLTEPIFRLAVDVT